MWPAYAKPVQLINNYTEDHSSLGLNQPFLRDKCASKFVRKERLIRHVQTAKNVRGRKSKDAGPAHKAMEEGGNHERKVRLYRLRKYHQVATEEWREGESAGSNKPRYNKLREHQAHQQHAQTSVSTSESMPTTFSEPRMLHP